MPFLKPNGESGPEIQLRQVGPNSFQVMTPFKYQDPIDGGFHDVPAHDATKPSDSTDLASVPWILWWFIASYGHQTRPALLHDHLVRPGAFDRHKADRIFRTALCESGVGFWRRWTMWAAVSVLTVMKKHTFRFVLLVVQLTLGLVLLSWAVLTGAGFLPATIDLSWLPWIGASWVISEIPAPWLVWLPVPLVLASIWGKWFPLPAIGTYAGFVLLPATLAVVLTISLLSIFRTAWWILNGGQLPDGGGPFIKPTAFRLGAGVVATNSDS